MTGSIYNIVKNDLQNLSLQTALLESCDWDEALLEEFSSFLSIAFHFVGEETSSYDEGLVLLKETFEINGYTNGQYDIVIRLIESHAEEIKSFMLLEEQ
tara:strand:+ start:574 stop:870 length:297 start_codon:yes stop_codon:yes gene_type:complete